MDITLQFCNTICIELISHWVLHCIVTISAPGSNTDVTSHRSAAQTTRLLSTLMLWRSLAVKMDQSLTLMDSTLLLSRRLGETSSKRNCLALKKIGVSLWKKSHFAACFKCTCGEVRFLSDPVARERNVVPLQECPTSERVHPISRDLFGPSFLSTVAHCQTRKTFTFQKARWEKYAQKNMVYTESPETDR